MKKYIVKVSEIAEKDFRKIIEYLRNELSGDIIADKYKMLFKQRFKKLEEMAGSVSILDKKLTGHNGIRKINVKNYIIFYTIDEHTNTVTILRLGHAFMDWEKYLKE